MGKSKQQRTISLSNGGIATFDCKRFHDAVDAMWKGSVPKMKKQDVYDILGKAIYEDYSTWPQNQISSWRDQVKNWYHCNNGPSLTEEEISKMEATLGLKKGDLLKFAEEREDYNSMNTTEISKNTAPTYCPSLVGENRMIISTMKYAKEKEVAHELYGVLVDLIAAYLPVDEDVWVEARGESGWMDKFKEYPKRYPADMAIRKASLYLPRELRSQAEYLLDDMYGERTFGWEEAGNDPLHDMSTMSFYENKIKQFREYAEQNYSKNPDDFDDDDVLNCWVEIMREEDYKLFDRLDDIFADYLCD